jgi:hypothetical protein
LNAKNRLTELIVKESHNRKGDDHKVRSAIVKVNGEGKKANQLKRPINKLYSLEVRSQDEDKSNSANVSETQANIEQLVQDQRKANTAKKSRSNGRYDQEAMDKR